MIPLLAAANDHAAILQYHHVNNKMNNTSVTTERFREHLEYLKNNHYTVLPLEEIVEAIKNKTPLPEKSVAITFDDAFRSIYINAFPILKQYNFPFTIFINTDAVDRNLRKTLTWEQLREMGQYGATLANHTASHSYLIRREKNVEYGAWLEKAVQEIYIAEERIRLETGQSHSMLAYPYGEFSPQLQSIVKELKFVAFGQHSGPAGHQSTLTALPRFPVSGVYSKISSLKTKLNSIPLPVLETQLLDEKGNVLSSHVVANTIEMPKIRLTLGKTMTAISRLNCFASGESGIKVDIVNPTDNIVETQASKKIALGRSRYNCTLPTKEKGVFYWHSQPLIRLDGKGRWIAD